jgi:hypothetical protein
MGEKQVSFFALFALSVSAKKVAKGLRRLAFFHPSCSLRSEPGKRVRIQEGASAIADEKGWSDSLFKSRLCKAGCPVIYK